MNAMRISGPSRRRVDCTNETVHAARRLGRPQLVVTSRPPHDGRGVCWVHCRPGCWLAGVGSAGSAYGEAPDPAAGGGEPYSVGRPSRDRERVGACFRALHGYAEDAVAPSDSTAWLPLLGRTREHAIWRGWTEAPRASLRREVSTVAAGAGSEEEVFVRVLQAGTLICERYSTTHLGDVTGYAVGLPHRSVSDGEVMRYDRESSPLISRCRSSVLAGPGQPRRLCAARSRVRPRAWPASEESRRCGGARAGRAKVFSLACARRVCW
jgi:hypothetical protein